ncbi:MAG: polymer-forming cytoskeletal protein [Chloroflexi bacterium]|nr:polymer-forming cytoskeletal protein [Chloroflexota bacterium]
MGYPVGPFPVVLGAVGFVNEQPRSPGCFNQFRVETGIRVDGVLKGELISSGTLIVGESGVIEADVKVHDAFVSGRIVGTLEAEDKVHLQANSAFVGKIKTRTLIVEEGAIFKAECDAGGEIRVNDSGAEDAAQKVKGQQSG